MASPATGEDFSDVCRKCGEVFIPTPRQRARWSHVCNDCNREYKRKWESERRAKGLPVRGIIKNQKEYVAKYLASPKAKATAAALRSKYAKDPLYVVRRRAWGVVRQAVNAGRLAPQSCETCGLGPTQAHHDDYSKPLQVRWLCDKHHKQHHRKISTVNLNATQVMLGLSAISTGLEQIERGKVGEGYAIARHGLDYLRELLSDVEAKQRRAA